MALTAFLSRPEQLTYYKQMLKHIQGADDKLGQTFKNYEKCHSFYENECFDLKFCTRVPWHVLIQLHSINLFSVSGTSSIRLWNRRQALATMVLSKLAMNSVILVSRDVLVL